MKKILKKAVLFFLIAFFFQTSFAQNDDLTTLRANQQKIEAANIKLNADIKELRTELNDKKQCINDMRAAIEANIQLSQNINAQLETKISTSGTKSSTEIESLHKSVDMDRLIWIVFFLLLVLLAIVLFCVICRKFTDLKASLLETIELTKATMDDKNKELENKLSQMFALQKKSTNTKE